MRPVETRRENVAARVSTLLRCAVLAMIVPGAAACEPNQSDAAVRLDEAVRSSTTGEPAACTREAPGCACDAGSAPVSCYAEPVRGEGDVLQCARGTMSCVDGRWSSCESLVAFEIQAPRGERKDLGMGANQIISPATQCNPCNPECFVALDRPTAGDLVASNSGDVEYHPESGGIRLRSLVDLTKRGKKEDPAVCGDGKVEGVEICDDGNTRSGDGCAIDCRLEDGFHCATAGRACKRTVCGDKLREGTEQCDDGNLLIGDGCTPFCAREPKCTGGACDAVCGDGKIMPGEGCDDGNTRSGDGCSGTCTLEAGFQCEVRSQDPPPYMDLPIVYRDFRASHPDFEDACCGVKTGMVQSTWGADKKPVPIVPVPNKDPNKSMLTTAANFNQWYNDSSASITFADRLRVTRDAKTGTYVFDSASFFPLTGRGWTGFGEPQLKDNTGKQQNFHFTSEVRFWFQYVPGQKLTFRGDDDVWVFINGVLAVDIGGVHGATAGSVTLDASTAAKFGLTAGGLYEAAVFQAERHTSQSNYRLELGGFFFGRTECAAVCGDGVVTNEEVCDDGAKNGLAGHCQTDCQGWMPKFASSAPYWRDYDANERCHIPPERPQWGTFTWDGDTPGQTSIELEFRASPTREGLSTARPVVIKLPSQRAAKGSLNLASLFATNKVQKDEPYVRVSAVLKASPDEMTTPVLREFELRYTCAFVE